MNPAESWKDVLLLVGALGPLVLAVIAILIAGWQVVQAYRHSERIHQINALCNELGMKIEGLRKDTELNRIYSDLIRLLAINLMSTDAIQESRLRILERGPGSRILDPDVVRRKIDELNAQYVKLVDEISLLSPVWEVRRQSILALGAGTGDMESYDLLHDLVRRFANDDSDEAKSYWAAIGMIRERYLKRSPD